MSFGSVSFCYIFLIGWGSLIVLCILFIVFFVVFVGEIVEDLFEVYESFILKFFVMFGLIEYDLNCCSIEFIELLMVVFVYLD